MNMNMMPPPPSPWPACQLCARHRGVVFCPAHGARLCLHCDDALHRRHDLQLHARASLCDACAAEPAALRCGDLFALCAACGAARSSPSSSAMAAAATGRMVPYVGRPHPLDLLRHISLSVSPEAPSSGPSPSSHHHLHHHHAGQEAPAAAGGAVPGDIEKLLAEDWTGLNPHHILNTISTAFHHLPQTHTQTALAQASSSTAAPHHLPTSPAAAGFHQHDAHKPPVTAHRHSSMMLRDDTHSHMQRQRQEYPSPTTNVAATASSKKQDMREQAILRYNDKKKKRFCKARQV